MERVVGRFENWVRRQPIAGMKVEVARLEGRTPLVPAAHRKIHTL